MAGRRAWRNSEEIAARILEKAGFSVVDFHVPVIEEGIEVGEIDIVAKKDGEEYAIEVKAGMADINAVRQAYVNAVIAGLKPMIIARGADEAARKLAEKLGVSLIVLPDVVVSSTDDIKEIVEEAVEQALTDLLEPLLRCREIGDEDRKVLEALAMSQGGFRNAAEYLGLSVEEFAKRVERLRKSGLLPKGSSKKMRIAALVALVGCERLGERSGVARA
ncbi:MAG: restriction endonuclease [Aeropyrum sp.]|nr:restriction endonuclease [Aeropyrum sp.]MCE4616546.1 restriction endonuclease [Aeropyrum sp.]